MMLHEDRFFPASPSTLEIARRLYREVRDLPLICPHGHTDPAWFAENTQFSNPTELLVKPDHYVLRMLVSQGVSFADLGFGPENRKDPREIWRIFAGNYHLFRATPVRHWLDYTFEKLFRLSEPLNAASADLYYDTISDCLGREAYHARGLFEQFNIEVLATTEAPNDTLAHHRAIAESGWDGRVISTYRPDPVTDPDFEGFLGNVDQLGEITGENTDTWRGYLRAHRVRRAYFTKLGTTATDHGHPTARTADLSSAEAEALFGKLRSGKSSSDDHELFRAQMLTEMARMSLDDGLVMQLHPGARRNHSSEVFASFGRDKGFDIPQRTDFVGALQPLLNKFGLDSRLTLIVFTLDESTYGRELAPLAGAYPSLRLGPAWWFFDSPAGMMRYREMITETAGFYNTVGFNDDTRALPSIAARHDMARRIDCSFLANKVATHELRADEAADLAHELAYGLAKRAYKL